MKFCVRNLSGWLMAVVLIGAAGGAAAATAANPRGGATNGGTTATGTPVTGRTSGPRVASRVATTGGTTSRATQARTGTVISRAANTISGIVKSRSAVTARSGTIAASDLAVPRAERSAVTGIARSALSTAAGASHARAANTKPGMSRAGLARATAVFSDVSKIGGGYASCRDSYATCMDQFCANANDTYRRCFCSSRYTEFRDVEDALDQAKLLLMKFQDNNLNAVDKTAAEVTAMYTATAGEKAIKKDTSGAAKMLDEVGDLLSGKKRAVSPTKNSTSLGVLSFDFSTDVDDVWGGGGGGIFSDNSSAVNMASMEGEELYKNANKQCLALMADSCESTAVLNMATSSYGIMITQDCNLYEKTLDSKKEAVQQTVRTAEKYLREARLEEYRTHNSADVNECLDRVRTALLAETACGPNYKRCLDYSGAYINQSTGEPIYSPRLFQLTDMITLGGINGSMDVLSGNAQFNEFLDSKRIFAQTALDTCRDMANTVWTEFKRTALIEIAQAQDEKIEEVKMSCVSTMKECYDTQSGALKSFDDTTAQQSGALSAYAAKAMCQDKVIACAALYGDTGNCNVGADGKIGNKDSCGLTALLKFVDNVDEVRAAEGCDTAIESYLKDLCTPTGTKGKTASSNTNNVYPWNCRGFTVSDLEERVGKFALDNCYDPSSGKPSRWENLDTRVVETVRSAVRNVAQEIEYQLMEACENLDGYWMVLDENNPAAADRPTNLSAFYSTVYSSGASSTLKQPKDNEAMGVCVENTTMVRCLAYNDEESGKIYATYDKAKDVCTFTSEWYEMKCASIGNGYYDAGVCYVIP